MRLSRKITFSFILAILLSIFIVSFISNIMISNRFETYLVEEQENRLQQISLELNSLYFENNYTLYQSDIDSYASVENITIKIRDLAGNLLYSSTDRNTMGGMGGIGRMGGMHRGMMHMNNIPEGNYVEKSFPLLEENTPVGNLIIGYIDNSYLTESALIFKDTLTKSLFVSGLFTVFIGIGTSLVLSRSLTTPLLDIRNTAMEIREGNLNKRSEVETNTVEIVELSDSINYLGETLARQEDIRRKYATDISHELRTPLSTLKGHLEAIMDKIWEPSDDHLNILMGEIDRLSSLVDDLKDSFRAEEYEIILNKTKFNLSQALQEIVTNFTPLYAKEGFTINTDIEKNLSTYMDMDKLKQVIFNLLSNSIKYLDDNGYVMVSLKKHQDSYLINIRDNGRGIQEKDLPYIFDRFFRSTTDIDANIDGTGLGLPIVKSIIKAHNGTINIDSVYGEGTEVIITLPIVN